MTMIRIIGFYRGAFIDGKYQVISADDILALATLYGEFRGAIMKINKQGGVACRN